MDEEYSGMVDDKNIYAIRCATPWVEFPDLGPHRVIDPANNTAGQNDKLLQYNFRASVYKSEQNMKAAVIAGLNVAVPSAYKRVTGVSVGTQMYRTTDDPQEIIRELRRLYGRLSPSEREAMDTKWNAPWNTSMPLLWRP